MDENTAAEINENQENFGSGEETGEVNDQSPPDEDAAEAAAEACADPENVPVQGGTPENTGKAENKYKCEVFNQRLYPNDAAARELENLLNIAAIMGFSLKTEIENTPNQGVILVFAKD